MTGPTFYSYTALASYVTTELRSCINPTTSGHHVYDLQAGAKKGGEKGASCVQKANRSSHLATCKLNKG